MKRSGQVITLSGYESRLTNMPTYRELVSDTPLAHRQDHYDQLHARRVEVADNGAWASPAFFALLGTMLRIDYALHKYGDMHIRLASWGIESGRGLKIQ